MNFMESVENKNRVSSPANVVKESYFVEGMTCSSCERTVERAVGNLEGGEVGKCKRSIIGGNFGIRSSSAYSCQN
jgi:hypothetical protein